MNKETREARLLDFEIKRAQERDKKRESAEKQAKTQKRDSSSPSQQSSEKPTPTSLITPLTEQQKFERGLPPQFRSKSIERERDAYDKRKSLDEQRVSLAYDICMKIIKCCLILVNSCQDSITASFFRPTY